MSTQKVYVIGHFNTRTRFAPNMGQDRVVDSYANYYKIGVSDTPKARASNMSVGTPHELKLVSTIDSEDAKRVENYLHSIFRPCRHTGEWFKLPTNPVNSLKALNTLQPSELEAVSMGETDWNIGNEVSLYVAIQNARNNTAEQEHMEEAE